MDNVSRGSISLPPAAGPKAYSRGTQQTSAEVPDKVVNEANHLAPIAESVLERIPVITTSSPRVPVINLPSTSTQADRTSTSQTASTIPISVPQVRPAGPIHATMTREKEDIPESKFKASISGIWSKIKSGPAALKQGWAGLDPKIKTTILVTVIAITMIAFIALAATPGGQIGVLGIAVIMFTLVLVAAAAGGGIVMVNNPDPKKDKPKDISDDDVRTPTTSATPRDIEATLSPLQTPASHPTQTSQNSSLTPQQNERLTSQIVEGARAMIAKPRNTSGGIKEFAFMVDELILKNPEFADKVQVDLAVLGDAHTENCIHVVNNDPPKSAILGYPTLFNNEAQIKNQINAFKMNPNATKLILPLVSGSELDHGILAVLEKNPGTGKMNVSMLDPLGYQEDGGTYSQSQNEVMKSVVRAMGRENLNETCMVNRVSQQTDGFSCLYQQIQNIQLCLASSDVHKTIEDQRLEIRTGPQINQWVENKVKPKARARLEEARRAAAAT